FRACLNVPRPRPPHSVKFWSSSPIGSLASIPSACSMGNDVMKKVRVWCLLQVVVAHRATADETKEKSAAFPGDLGRPFDGLPLPNGPGRRPPWPSRPPPARGPSVELALQAAQEAVAACTGSHVGVAIIDSAGTPKLYYIPDGTAGFHAYTGFRKAYTA